MAQLGPTLLAAIVLAVTAGAYAGTSSGYLSDIWLVRADGTERRALTHSKADDGDPAWLPPSD